MRQFYTLYGQKLSNLLPLLSITFPQEFQKYKKFGNWTLWNGGKKTFKQSEQIKKSVKNFFSQVNLTPFISKSCQIWDHFFSLLFPKDSINIKRHLTLGSGGKKTVKRSEKVWRTNTHTHTDRQTNTRTSRLRESIDLRADALKIKCELKSKFIVVANLTVVFIFILFKPTTIPLFATYGWQ